MRATVTIEKDVLDELVNAPGGIHQGQKQVGCSERNHR